VGDLKKLKIWFMNVVKEYCLRFDEDHPLIVFKRHWRYLIVSMSLFSLLVISLILVTLIHFPLLIVLILICALSCSAITTLVISFIPYLKLRSHFEELEKEALWLATLVRFHSITGQPILKIFDTLAEVPFKAIQREAKAFLRLSITQGRLTTLVKELVRVPRGAWYQFLRYVESVAIHGQNSETASEAMYRSIEVRYRAYLERKVAGMNTLAIGVTSLFALLPLTMLTIASIIASKASAPIAISTTVINVLLAVVVIATSLKTFSEEPLLHKQYLKCIPLIPAPVVSYVLASQLLNRAFYSALAPLSLITVTIISLALADKLISSQLKITNEIFEHTPIFLGDCLVHMSQGKDLVTAAMDVLDKTSYSEDFDEFMKMMTTSAMVSGFEEALRQFKKAIQRSIFIILYLALKASWFGNLAALSAVIEALRDYKDIVLTLKRKLSIIRIVFLMAVLISLGMTVYMLKCVVPMLANLSLSMTSISMKAIVVMPMEFITPDQIPQLKELICLSLFINSTVGALTIGAISSLRLAGGIRFALITSLLVGTGLFLFLLGVI